MTRIYTRTGDDGKTYCVAAGDRVSKASPLIEFVGTIDEAVSALGFARSLCEERGCDERILDLLDRAQLMVFSAGFSLSGSNRFRGDEIEYLESATDNLMSSVEIKGFIVPGRTLESAAIHVARTIVRRAERRLQAVIEGGLVELNSGIEYARKVLNRLSDALFAAAVYIENERGVLRYL
ncbi:MAG: cob(I)yrinic acid a,c-diamide adenosyltransferase [Desulfurococcales archaeon]|nr:cob(I)yrinic acid a,c-diamide adenosyltransferase [Desulfurococcales archaeon]